MRRIRFTIASLLVVVLLVAVGFAALREASDLWDSGVFTVTLAILNKAERLAAAQVIQANLAAVGVTVEIEPHDSGTFWSLGAEKKGDSWKKLQLILDRFSMEPDPSWATLWFTPEQIGVWNWERFNSKEFGELNKQVEPPADIAAWVKLCLDWKKANPFKFDQGFDGILQQHAIAELSRLTASRKTYVAVGVVQRADLEISCDPLGFERLRRHAGQRPAAAEIVANAPQDFRFRLQGNAPLRLLLRLRLKSLQAPLDCLIHDGSPR